MSRVRLEDFGRKKSIFIFSLLSFFLALSCSHKDVQQANVAPDAVPQTEIQKTDQRLAADRQSQMDMVAPDYFFMAEDYLADAKTALQKNKSTKQILDDVAWANGYLDRAEQVTGESATTLSPVLTARQAAIQAQAPMVNHSQFVATDKQFRKVTKKLRPGNMTLSTKDISELQAAYLNQELAAIKATKLTEAYGLTKNAEDMGAAKLAPQTLAETRLALTNAERAIETDRHNAAVVDQASQTAVNQARRLVNVVQLSRNAKGSTEAAAISMYNRSSQLNRTESELHQTEMEKADLQRQLATESNRTNTAIVDLQNQNSNLKQQNDKLSDRERFDAALEKAQSEFSPSEAEVYRQGDNLIIRLKSMNFTQSRSELPPASLASLKKAKDIIADLDAQKVTVEGHTDSTGGATINKEISQKRAEAVKTYLIHEGAVAENKVDAVGVGYDKPLTSDKTKEGRKMNRRVDIIITPSTTL